MCLNVLGVVAFVEPDLDIARALREECLALSRQVDDPWETAWARGH